MANARSRYDSIAGYLQRVHEAQANLLYGRPCLLWGDRAFAVYQTNALALRMHGRYLTQASTLPGVQAWDPRNSDGAAPGWVLIPVEQVLRWDRLALDALRCTREAAERRISYAAFVSPVRAIDEPAPSNPASLTRSFTAAIAAGFRSLSLSRLD
jgi:hypothetical protein